MTTPSDTPQLNIWLAIQPEDAGNKRDRAVANDIKSEISEYLVAQGYPVESVYTGKLFSLHDLVIPFFTASTPFIAKVLQTIVDKEVDNLETQGAEAIHKRIVGLVKDIGNKLKTSKHKDLPAEVTASLPTGQQIQTHGPLAPAFTELLAELQKSGQEITEVTATTQEKQATSQGTTETTREATITIKFSHS